MCVSNSFYARHIVTALSYGHSPHHYNVDMSSRNPSVIPSDTSTEVWRRQMDAIANQSVEQHLRTWAELNTQFARMEERAVCRLHPNFSDHEVLVELVRRRYGDALVEAMQPKGRRLVS